MFHDERGTGYALQQFVRVVLFTVRPELHAASGEVEVEEGVGFDQGDIFYFGPE